MSVRVLSKVWEFFPEGGCELLTLLALADWSDDEGLSFPSIASLAKKTRLSSSQARRNVHALINSGYVNVVGNKYGGGSGSSRRYKIVLSLLAPSMHASPSVVARGGVNAQHDSHLCTITTSPHASLTIIEPSLSKAGFELPDWVPKTEWSAFVDHRKKLKKELTPYSMNLAVKQLQKIVDEGHKPEDVINESILRGWRSFYAPKNIETNASNIMDGVL
jgi:hypothetical protein